MRTNTRVNSSIRPSRSIRMRRSSSKSLLSPRLRLPLQPVRLVLISLGNTTRLALEPLGLHRVVAEEHPAGLLQLSEHDVRLAGADAGAC